MRWTQTASQFCGSSSVLVSQGGAGESRGIIRDYVPCTPNTDDRTPPRDLDSGLLFGPPHQRSTMHEQRPLYRIHGQGFVLLNMVGFRAHRSKGCRDSVG
jgi:hypothetical protein